MLATKSNHKGMLIAALIASLGAGLSAAVQMNPIHRTKPRKAGRRATPLSGRKSTLHTTNGARECARRLRQIEAGTLQTST